MEDKRPEEIPLRRSIQNILSQIELEQERKKNLAPDSQDYRDLLDREIDLLTEKRDLLKRSSFDLELMVKEGLEHIKESEK